MQSLDGLHRESHEVDDVAAAVQWAEAAGAEIAHPPMELPDHGTFAIYIQGGIHHGLRQV